MAEKANIFFPVEDWPDEVQLFHEGRLEGPIGRHVSYPLAYPMTGTQLRLLGYEMTRTITTQSVFWKRQRQD